MREFLLRGCVALVSFALVVPPAYPQTPAPAPAPTPAPAPSGAAAPEPADVYSDEQLDALLAPIALYPDQLLAQVLMAATYPLDIVAASRWLESGNNKSLTGDALAKALATQPWDPSVKSIVAFPQVLAMMNQNLDWTQQLGFAVANQQSDVMGSVQRLRAQAQQAGMLKTSDQQVVTTSSVPGEAGAPPQQAIVIEPANPQVVYVPTYNPSVVFGTWPYATPPVYLPPPPGYAFGTALATGLAFAAGVAVVGSLWGWARPGWGYGGGYGGGWGGSINVNNNRYTNISNNNINRGTVNNGRWQASRAAPGRVPNRPPPNGPVGRPNRGNGLPPNAIGRPSVNVPGGAVNRPNIGQRPGGGPNVGNRPNLPPAGGINRPGGVPARGAPATGPTFRTRVAIGRAVVRLRAPQATGPTFQTLEATVRAALPVRVARATGPTFRTAVPIDLAVLRVEVARATGPTFRLIGPGVVPATGQTYPPGAGTGRRRRTSTVRLRDPPVAVHSAGSTKARAPDNSSSEAHRAVTSPDPAVAAVAVPGSVVVAGVLDQAVAAAPGRVAVVDEAAAVDGAAAAGGTGDEEVQHDAPHNGNPDGSHFRPGADRGPGGKRSNGPSRTCSPARAFDGNSTRTDTGNTAGIDACNFASITDCGPIGANARLSRRQTWPPGFLPPHRMLSPR